MKSDPCLSKPGLTEAESTPGFPNPVLPNVQMEKRALKGGTDVHCALLLCGRGNVWTRSNCKENLKCNGGVGIAQSAESSPNINKAPGSIPSTASWDKDKKLAVSELGRGRWIPNTLPGKELGLLKGVQGLWKAQWSGEGTNSATLRPVTLGLISSHLKTWLCP